MGRDKMDPLTVEKASNAADLLSRVNYLFGRLNIKTTVTSGYRPEHINIAVGGASKSGHVTCEAIDVLDPFGKTGLLLKIRTDLLIECGLWLENPEYTKKLLSSGKFTHWVHLQTRLTKNRIFNP